MRVAVPAPAPVTQLDGNWGREMVGDGGESSPGLVDFGPGRTSYPTSQTYPLPPPIRSFRLNWRSASGRGCSLVSGTLLGLQEDSSHKRMPPHLSCQLTDWWDRGWVPIGLPESSPPGTLPGSQCSPLDRGRENRIVVY